MLPKVLFISKWLNPSERISYSISTNTDRNCLPRKSLPKLYDLARPNNEGSIFKDMYEYSGKEKYKNVFIELCESLVEKQEQSSVLGFYCRAQHGRFLIQFKLIPAIVLFLERQIRLY
jgi:hypothetical protein